MNGIGLAPGQYVIDRDDDDPDLAAVVQYPGTTIAETRVTYPNGKERTVAEDNPAYEADEPAVTVAFVESGLDQSWPEWRDSSAEDLSDGIQDHGVKCYTFPEARLTPVQTEADSAVSPQRTVEIDALQTRLEDAEWSVTLADDGALIAEKMGDRYRTHRQGRLTARASSAALWRISWRTIGSDSLY
ncbi:hypothetical protein CP556_20075 [Natrinema sp. CBA1119]|uniref:hypothetical protein n=1 Tax=Natrinema sp. CBA1119 TaxID=1608465 RepID=UPI000BF9D1BA|nr:hypothetical protein [Natrinema sp. CBA1119]PGF14444.1 hypothetical protein CP556_20075 [Natrinema sp. CBA1119]